MKKVKWIIAALFLGAGVVCGGMAFRSYWNEKNAGDEYQNLKEEVKTEPTVTDTPEPTKEAEAIPTSEPVEIPIDFPALQKKNPEVYAWIQIPGTQIDYPILQSAEDNSYYLTHTLEGKKKPEGAIYTEDYNTKDFTDPNTVIYGHNMKNGSMFRELHNYQDRAFFKEHPDVTIYLPDQILHYQIFAAYVYDDRHLMQSFDFSDPDVFEFYIGLVKNQKGMGNYVDDSVEIGKDDKIITMSTCNGNKEQRYIVQAVLLSIEK